MGRVGIVVARSESRQVKVVRNMEFSRVILGTPWVTVWLAFATKSTLEGRGTRICWEVIRNVKVDVRVRGILNQWKWIIINTLSSLPAVARQIPFEFSTINTKNNTQRLYLQAVAVLL